MFYNLVMFGVKRDKHPAPELCLKDGQAIIHVPFLSWNMGLASVSFGYTYPKDIYDKMTLLRSAGPPSNVSRFPRRFGRLITKHCMAKT